MSPARLAAALAAILLPAAAVAQAPQQDLSGFRWFGALAGACWRGEHADGRTVDTQCYSSQFGRVLRGTIRIETRRPGAVTAFEGDSVFAWDPKAGKIRYSQWAANGGLAHGEATWEGDVLRFATPPADGGEPRARFAWRRLDEDSFRVTRERREDAGWVEAGSVEYRRAP